MKFALIGLALLTLTACNEEERAKELKAIQQSLPKGCAIMDLGRYGEIDNVLAVYCEGQSTVSLNQSHTEIVGKVAHTRANVTISFN